MDWEWIGDPQVPRRLLYLSESARTLMACKEMYSETCGGISMCYSVREFRAQDGALPYAGGFRLTPVGPGRPGGSAPVTPGFPGFFCAMDNNS